MKFEIEIPDFCIIKDCTTSEALIEYIKNLMHTVAHDHGFKFISQQCIKIKLIQNERNYN